MGLFNFSWLSSEERQELKRIREEKAALESKVAELEQASQLKTWGEQWEEVKAKADTEKLITRLIYVGDILTVMLREGQTYSKAGVTPGEVQAIRGCQTEGEIVAILYPAPPVVEEEDDYLYEESPIVEDDLNILKDHEDFIVKDGKAYLKGVGLELPPVVLASFIEILERGEEGFHSEDVISDDEIKYQGQYEALKMFWYWTALNPIESSRKDLLSFVEKNDIKISSNGLLEMYRRVVSTGEQNKELTKFISEQYFKIKKWKKNTSNYFVVEEQEEVVTTKQVDNGYYETGEWDEDSEDYLEDEWIEDITTEEVVEYKKVLRLKDKDSVNEDVIGNLQELYLNLPELQENTFTDGHTKRMVIKVGEVYKEDESRIDLDNSKTCSAGLHVGSHSFLFDGFGDTGVLALVNPMKVRSVPTAEANKMRVSEMMICCTLDIEQYKEHILSEDINDYSEQYYNTTLGELEESLKNKSFGSLECQENLPAISIKEIFDIKEILRNRIQQVV